MESRRMPTSGVSASRSFISRVAERFIWFGLGVFVTISIFHGYNVHTTDQFEASTLKTFFSLDHPNDAVSGSKRRPTTKTKRWEMPLSLKNNGITEKKRQPKFSHQRQPPEETKPGKAEKLAVETLSQQNDQREQGRNILKKRVDTSNREKNATHSDTEKAHVLRFDTKDMEQIQADASKQSEQKKDDDRLNIVLLYADDWTMKVLGKFDPNVKTPNIDKMADNGLLFTNNCVTTSVCWISRATLVTGVYYSRHLQFAPHSTNMFTTNPWNETLFPRLKSAGYYTGLMGKWHVPQPEPEMTMSFDKWDMYYGEHWSEDYSAHGSSEVMQITDKNLNDALDFLQTRPKDKPFFLKVSYFATHAWDSHEPPYVPKNETKRKYYPSSMFVKPPKTATNWHWENLPRFFTDQNEGRNRWRNRFDELNFQENIKSLYAMATEVDDTVGVIIEELKRQNLTDNTMIIFTTDNGNLHGEHGLAEKWYPFEEALRVPLVIQDPRIPKSKRGTTIDEWTLSVDLAPTILGAAQLEKSSFMQGRNLAQLYLDDPNVKRTKDGKIKWRNDWYYEWNMGDPLNASGHPQTNFIDAAQALITNEWKYIFWPEQDFEQLFNRRIDPFDEWDLIKKDNLMNSSFFNATADNNLQTTQKAYDSMKARFIQLRDHVIAGKPI
ncbi:arylsulfatase [Nitzschia inconspicua]|uniref:Arylsulfatase n=1 Tax=Nitzschia inconspicua TaxID=303405 RepID=A0A9K3PD23_9STRA|nr:arylsulfatase [Nitzschia inconspicua]